ncbi:mucin-associated surface protein (MASP) [Trypanosoma cruzi]|nr:mucin-associated surface protein (MASP) [Trypanosoma cruzi]
MAMMMTGRVLLVCALCVLWCGAGGVYARDGENNAQGGCMVPGGFGKKASYLASGCDKNAPTLSLRSVLPILVIQAGDSEGVPSKENNGKNSILVGGVAGPDITAGVGGGGSDGRGGVNSGGQEGAGSSHAGFVPGAGYSPPAGGPASGGGSSPDRSATTETSVSLSSTSQSEAQQELLQSDETKESQHAQLLDGKAPDTPAAEKQSRGSDTTRARVLATLLH